jgi:phospholipase C
VTKLPVSVAVIAAAAILNGGSAHAPDAAAPAAAVAPSGVCGGLAGNGVPRIRHVIVLIFENRNVPEIVGNPDAPTFNRLATDCALATSYYAVAFSSLRDYMALTGGYAWQSLRRKARSIFEQVRSWKSYMESMPVNCDQAPVDGVGGRYLKAHNPAVFYARIRRECLANDVPLGDTSSGAFATDLARGMLPEYSLVVPDGCNDMHGDCEPHESRRHRIRTGDAWLAQWLAVITAAPQYLDGSTIVFVTFDEGVSSPEVLDYDCFARPIEICRVPTFVVSRYVRPGLELRGFYTHYSLLKTTEELLGVPFLGHAADPGTVSLLPELGLSRFGP